MTIGIAISGPQAGMAAFRALQAVEAVGRGAIGGFVSLVAINQNGNVVSASTQRAGTAGLFGGVLPPSGFSDARLAALMSSGPDRPEPLAQFTPGDAAAGLVTGHRLPNMRCPSGEIPNQFALSRLAAGADPEQAVAAALALYPEADAGLIAMDLSGRIALGNSKSVARRDDLGEVVAEDLATGLRMGVLHNSIFPHRALAALAVAAAIDAVAPPDVVDGEAMLVGVTLKAGAEHSLLLDSDGVAQEITVPETAWFGPAWEGSPVRRGDPVRQEGQLVGYITREVYGITRNGKLVGARGPESAAWRRANHFAKPLGDIAYPERRK